MSNFDEPVILSPSSFFEGEPNPHEVPAEERYQARCIAISERYAAECERHRQRERDAPLGFEADEAAATHEVESAYADTLRTIEQRYEREEAAFYEEIKEIETATGALACPIAHVRAELPAPAANPTVLRVGTVPFTTPWGSYDDPVVVPFLNTTNLCIKTESKRHGHAISLLHTLLVRLYAGLAPGKLRCTFIDPNGLAENVSPFLHLRDVAPHLIDHAVRTQRQEIEASLTSHLQHVQHVNEQLLRDTYPSIHEYNQAMGELSEPYRVVVIIGFPTHFDQAALQHLRHLLQAGPRCGVNAIILASPDTELPFEDDLETWSSIITCGTSTLTVAVSKPYRYDVGESDSFESDSPPDNHHAILKNIGTLAHRQEHAALSFEHIAPQAAARGTATSETELRIPLGLQAGRPQELLLGTGTRHHVLIAGTIGSGKSNLLHVLITNLSLTYAPGEIELYLVDFKSGVEFQPYAKSELPTATAIAVDSEPEFGLSVLHGLSDEVERRNKLFRDHGAQNLAGYRKATGQQLPRIVLIMDEFQRLFVERDSIDFRARKVLDDITRVGRAVGVHVVLCTQTLSGAKLFSQSTAEQLNIRIALKVATAAQSQQILADNNTAASTLDGTGFAIYNRDTGKTHANEIFRIAYLPPEERDRCLDGIHTIWHDTPSRPPRIFEGKRFARLPHEVLIAAFRGRLTPKRPAVMVGQPLAIAPPLTVPFERRSTQSLLIIGNGQQAATGLSSACLLSLAAQNYPTLVVDWTIEDPGLAPLAARLPNCKLLEPNHLLTLLQAVAHSVQHRISRGPEPPTFVVLFGVHRAINVRASTAYAHRNDKKEPTANDYLDVILDEGPAVGVHTILWCETVANFYRNIQKNFDAFDFRLALQMSEHESSAVLGKKSASELGDYQAMFHHHSQGLRTKFFPYAQPTNELVTDLLANR